MTRLASDVRSVGRGYPAMPPGLSETGIGARVLRNGLARGDGGTLVRRWPTGTLLLIASVGAAACPLCGSWQGYASAEEVAFRHAARTTPSGSNAALPDVIDVIRDDVPTAGARYRLDQNAAVSAVLALPGDNGARLKVVEVIRGDSPGAAIDGTAVNRLDSGAAVKGKPLLLMRANTWQSWVKSGVLSAPRIRAGCASSRRPSARQT